MKKLLTTAIGSLLLFGGNVQADFVINDDLIVDGSTCVGFDCVNGESFGFDTIRLKENNLRIKFQDTSGGSFPTRDWQITANSSQNGGLSKFSIDDIDGGRTPFTIEANAPSHSLYVDDGGRLGLGTSTPVVDVHVISGNTPTLRLEQNGSSGFTPQTWDVAGNETNFFVRDATNGSTLPFRIRPGAPSSSIFIDADGDVGIGTASPADDGFSDRLLEVKDSDSVRISIDYGTGSDEFGDYSFEENNDIKWNFGATTEANANTRFYIYNDDRNTYDLNIADDDGYIGLDVINPTHPIQTSVALANGAHLTSGGVWQNGSSRSFKKDISTLASEEAMSTLRDLQPVSFRYKNEPGELYVGFIAEDVPDLVATNERKSLASMDIVAVLTKVVQTQQQSIEQLELTVAELKNQNSQLKIQ